MNKLITLITAAAMAAALSAPVFAAEQSEDIQIIFEDVTATDTSTLAGEAKIKVSVEGVTGDVSVAQLDLDFDGDLDYKSITYLTGTNDPAAGSALISPNTAAANAQKRMMPSIISTKTPIEFGGTEELFILTFAGEPGGVVSLELGDLDNSYFTIDGQDYSPAAVSGIENVTASDSENSGKEAEIKITLEKVPDFAAATEDGEYAPSGLELRITGENGSEYYTVLNNVPITKGGHRDATVTIPTFTVTNTVVDGVAYTVELSGIGYVPFKAENVTFDETLEITTDDFIPGDVNGDGVVDSTDKELCQAAVDDPESATDATDFNRDGKTDKFDMEVFEGIPDAPEGDVPAKMDAPEVEGGDGRIEISWEKPDDDSVTGYVLKYGDDEDSMDETVEINDADDTSENITGLKDNTRYYVSIAAKNENGTGEFSVPASAKTDSSSGGGNTGGGGGNTGGGGSGNTGGGNNGGGGNTGGSGLPGIKPTSTPAPETDGFTDLGGYEWAEEQIYLLRDSGIISGVSATEFAPANNIKRGDFMLILSRMLEINDEFTENFADVPADSYYYSAIGSARAAGIAQGNGENFMPENSITRQDLITLAYRAFLERGYITEAADTSSLDAFADRASVSDYAEAAMASMVSVGIIQGSDGNVNPLSNATRAEVAVMCARLLALTE